ncbi:DNA polymerase III subunit delta [Clostridioides sp. ZZV15-6598]|uniref:DNA polymerase III subunit delta n=1 Tax=Clostridioides sp. ZZV15-6598 TaxID=2811501 RepID=UPI001D10C8D3|nr:DNA polymerase III subunit delta [Clostridioides sp. ZZV15-6598]
MGKKVLLEKILDTPGVSYINEKVNLFKDTKWISFETYIMTVESFCYKEDSKHYNPVMGTFDYESEIFIVSAIYKDEVYSIKSKKLYRNVSKGDKIVVTIKYYYDKYENLIHEEIHDYHSYPLSND